MMVNVYNQDGKAIGKIDLPDKVFKVKWNPVLVQQALVAQLANERKILAHVKTRAEVRGGGKKPYAQKHTGRARAGSSRSPLWVGGGVTHGPNKNRNFSQKINRKMKRLALYSALSKKISDQELFVVDNLRLDNHKTKNAAKIFANFFKKPTRTLIIAEKGNRNIFLAARNIPKTKISNPESLNIYDCLATKHVLLEKNVVETLAK